MVAARINTDYLFSHLEVPDIEKKKRDGNDFKRLDSLSEFDISSFL